MTELGELVAAVAESGTDSARLVLGDYLEEHGQRCRGEYIQASCAAREDESAAARAEDLLAEHQGEWLGEWQGRLVDWDYRLGFIHGVRMTVSQFLRHGEELFRTEPVERLELVNDAGKELSPEEVREAVGHPGFAHVRDCAIVPARFRETHLGAWFTALARNSSLTRLRRLGHAGDATNWGTDFDQQDYSSFCRAGHLASLRELGLRCAPLDLENRPWLVAELAAAPFAASLEGLQLAHAGVTGEGLRELAANPAFSTLRRLEVHSDGCDPSAWQALLNSSNLGRVSTFSVQDDLLLDYANSRLASQVRVLRIRRPWHPHQELSPHERLSAWSTLSVRGPRPESLELNLHNPGEAAFKQLAQSRWLEELRSLSIHGASQAATFAGDRASGVEALFEPEAMPALRELSLHELGDRALTSKLGGWAGLERLTEVGLTDDYTGRLVPSDLGSEFVPRGARGIRGLVLLRRADFDALLSWPGLERVTQLRLAFCVSEAESSAVVAKLSGALLRDPRLGRMVDLSVGFGGVDEAPVIEALADVRVMPGLRRVRLFGAGTGKTSTAPLRSRFGLRFQA